MSDAALLLAGVEAARAFSGSQPSGHAKAKAKSQPALPRPRIDLDFRIDKAVGEYHVAKKALALKRAEAKLERRRKSRIIKKSATLSADDLERIAVLKRSGIFGPALAHAASATDPGTTEAPPAKRARTAPTHDTRDPEAAASSSMVPLAAPLSDMEDNADEDCAAEGSGHED